MNSPTPLAQMAPDTRVATLSAELMGECQGLGRETVPHRVWVHRDGSIETPDHAHDSDAEQVARALGYPALNLCQYWSQVHRLGATGDPHASLLTWRFTYTSLWTPKAQQLVTRAIINTAASAPLHPPLVLDYAQVYFRVSAGLPHQAGEHLGLLMTPWSRQQGGYRRSVTTTPQQLEQILRAGVPRDYAAVFAALNIDGDTASQALRHLRRWGYPADVFASLCYAVTPAAGLRVLETLDTERGRRLPSMLSQVRVLLEGNPSLSEGDICHFLLFQ